MKTSAIICELNPLHNGHMHIINSAKPDTVILAMSGNFTQRAGASICDKYARAEAAVRAGADLVVELPFPYSSSGAEFFAKVGVSILQNLGTDRILFGSQCADITLLSKIAKTLSSEEYRRLCEAIESDKPSLGAAQIKSMALEKLCEGYKKDECENPNDILAAEYLRFASCECVPVRRIENLSATSLRSMEVSDTKEYVPQSSFEMLNASPHADNSRLLDILWRFFRLTDINFENIAECKGGLGYRLASVARESTSPEEFIKKASTKKYTNTRILRAALFALLGVTSQDLINPPEFTYLLAASKKGCELLSRVRKNCKIKVITKPADCKFDSTVANRQLELSRKADELYTLLIDKAVKSSFFLTRSPYIEK